MKGDCGSCAKRGSCKSGFGILYGGCKNYEERQGNGEMRLFRVTFTFKGRNGFEWGLYSGTSREAVREFLEAFGVAESDIFRIGEVGRVPLGYSVVETGV